MIEQNEKSVKILMLLGQDLLRPKIDPRVYKEAKSLIKAGFKVTIISISCQGSLSQNYEGINLKVIADRVNLPALRNESLLFYMPKIMGGLMINLKNVVQAAKKIDYQIIHCHDADTLIFGLTLKLIHRNKVKLIYDSHEIATEMASFAAFKFYIGIAEKIASFFTDGFITINTSAKDFLLKKYPRFSKKVLILRNLPVIRIKLQAQLVKYPVRFIYQGNMKKDRKGIFGQIITTLKTINPKLWTLTLLVDQTDLTDIDLEASNIIIQKCIIDPLKFQQELNNYDVGIIAMDNVCLNNYYSLPNKLFDYMISGVAVLGPDYPEIAKVVNKTKSGFLFKNETELKKTINLLIDNPKNVAQMKKNGLEAVAHDYNWAIESDKLIQFYQELI